jgi:glycosyltransferase involved in cell wall biosynthesis
MSDGPRVTVVVPTFNAGQLLLETLESVRIQTVKDVEVIVVDDGSTDGTPDRVRRERPEVRVIEQPNGGVSRARNRGLDETRTPFVCFLDQDDVWHPLQLERQLACFEAHPEAVAVATPYWFWHPDTNASYRLEPWPDDPGREKLVHGFDGWTYHQFLRDCWALTSATLLRTEPVRLVGGFDATLPYSEDWDLWLRLARRHPFLQLAWPPVRYRQHPSQGSRRLRSRDYRCELLQRAAASYGLCSPDGQCVGRREFRRQLARYRMEFGYHQLACGATRPAVSSTLIGAWSGDLRQIKWLALAILVMAGWRPGEVSGRTPKRRPRGQGPSAP